MPACVSVERERPHHSWPKPVFAQNLQQFDGIYRNHSLDAITGEAAKGGYDLFDHLTGKSHAHGERGKRLELSSAPDGSALHMRLFDLQNHEIDSATLQRGAAFRLSGGKLILRGPLSGLRNLNSNWGPGVKSELDTLRLSTSGFLLGNTSENDVAFLMAIIPTARTAKQSMCWPKLAN